MAAGKPHNMVITSDIEWFSCLSSVRMHPGKIGGFCHHSGWTMMVKFIIFKVVTANVVPACVYWWGHCGIEKIRLLSVIDTGFRCFL